jgi:predicted anti-sigma-YlaC factor YlaD
MLVEASFDRECRAARELVSLSLDGELGALERRRLDRHLSDCAACRLYGARVEAITSALRTAPLERPSIRIPPYFYWRRRLLRMGIPATALAAVMLGLVFLQGSGVGVAGSVAPVSGAVQQARISYAIQPQPQPPIYADLVETR